MPVGRAASVVILATAQPTGKFASANSLDASFESLSTLKNVSILLAASLLASCAARPYDTLRDYKGSDAGLAVASVGTDDDRACSRTSVSFKQVGTNNLGYFGYFPKVWDASPKDFKSGEVTGTVAVVSLPGGLYDVFQYECTYVTGAFTTVSRRPINPNIRFEVKPGNVAYVGRFSFMTTRAGILPGGAADLGISDEQTFDLTVARKKSPTKGLGDVRSFVKPLRTPVGRP